MIVVREDCILDKIDKEINDGSKKDIIRIELNKEEFEQFLHRLRRKYFWGIHSLKNSLNGLTLEVFTSDDGMVYKEIIGNFSLRRSPSSYVIDTGSYVVYRDVCVQCVEGIGAE